MKVIIKPSFKRDRDKINNTVLLDSLADKLEQIEKAQTLKNITGLKPLRGYSTCYRIYIKTQRHSFRIGAIVRKNTVWLVRFMPRKKIYQKIPLSPYSTRWNGYWPGVEVLGCLALPVSRQLGKKASVGGDTPTNKNYIGQ